MLKLFKGFGWKRTRAFTLKGARKLAEAHEQVREANLKVITYLDRAIRGPVGKGRISKLARELNRKLMFSAAGSLIGPVSASFTFLGTSIAQMPVHAAVLASAAVALVGGVGGYKIGNKFAEIGRLKRLGEKYGQLEPDEYQLLAEIDLEKRGNETTTQHFERIRKYMERLRTANEMHDFCITALRNQIQRIEKRKKR